MIELGERIRAILDELRGHPEGLSFNQLCDRLKEKMARQTLSNRLSQLVKDGLVRRTPEKPRKGQRILYKSTEALKLIDHYIEVISYVASQQKQEIERLLDDWEEGKVSDKGFLDKLIDHIVRVPQRVMGIAYVLAYPYGESIVQYILLTAFKLCNMAESYALSLLRKREFAKKEGFREAFLKFLEQQSAVHH